MKAKILLPVVFIAIILAIAVAAVNHSNKTKTNEQHKEQAVVQAKDDQIESLTAERDENKGHADYNRLECEKGRAAYELLTPANKNETPKPECGAVLP